jgi:hypothetical protein
MYISFKDKISDSIKFQFVILVIISCGIMMSVVGVVLCNLCGNLLHDDIATCMTSTRQRLGKHIPAQAISLSNKTYIAKQRISKHISVTKEAVFSVGTMRNGCKKVFGRTGQ